MNNKYFFLIILSIASAAPVGAQDSPPPLVEGNSTPSAGDFPDPNTYFFLRSSDVRWQSALHQNALLLENSRLRNAILAGISPSTTHYDPIPKLHSAIGKNVETGFSFGSESGFTRGNLHLSYTGADGPAINVYSTSASSLLLNPAFSASVSNTASIDLLSESMAARYGLQYDQEFYFLNEHSNDYLNGIGARVGIMASHENIEIEGFRITRSIGSAVPLFAPSSTPAATTVTTGIAGFPEYNNKVDIGTLLFGLVYRFPISHLIQADAGIDYHQSVFSQGEINITTTALPLLLESESTREFEVDVSGYVATLGLTYRVSEVAALRLFYQYAGMRHATTISMATEPPELWQSLFLNLFPSAASSTSGTQAAILAPAVLAQSADDLGPLPTSFDRMGKLGIEVQLRF